MNNLEKALTRTDSTLGKSLFETLNKRIEILAVAIKLSCNSNLFFSGCDIDAALHYALEPIGQFMNECGKCYLSGLSSLIEAYSSPSDTEHDKYSYSIPYSDWNLFA